MIGGSLASCALATALVLASQAGGCEQQPGGDVQRSQVCRVDPEGVQVSEDGRWVTDVARARCDVRVEQHTLEAWLEYSTSKWGGWTMPRFPRSDSTIPDVEGVPLLVELPCKEGYYRPAWRTTGRGPALPDHPRGIPFDELDGDYGGTFIDADECAG